MLELKNYIFLTGSEIKIHSSYQLSVHLSVTDPRVKAILNNKDKKLYFIVLNPVVSWIGTFTPSKWYFFSEIKYTGKMITQKSSTSSKIMNLSFNWRLKYKNYNPTRELTTQEVEFFRANNYLNEH